MTQQQAQELAAVCDCNALSLTVVGGMIARQAVTAQVRAPARPADALVVSVASAVLA